MMKFIFQVISIMVAGYALVLFFPWYSVALGAFVFGYLLYSRANFLAGFFAIASLWATKIWMINKQTDSTLPDTIAQIIPVQEKMWLIALTICLGGLIGGFAALTGSLLRPTKKKGYY